jgi:HPt (histidine-containing phosphotransfer) domain-containing protein
MDEPLLDEAILEQIREVGGDELVLELFGIFTGLAEGRLQALDTARRAADYPAAALAAHSVKSSSASIGARSLAEVAGKVEKAANRESASGLEAGCVELRALAAELMAELAKRRAPR